MTTALTTAAQAELDAFGKNATGEQEQAYALLSGAVESTPGLVSWFNSATAGSAPELAAITYATNSSIASYDPSNHDLQLSDGYFNSIIKSSLTASQQTLAVVFLVGHESGHADDHTGIAGAPDIPGLTKAWDTNTLATFTNGIQASNDATNIIKSYVDIQLQDEGFANLQAWNDVVSYATANNIPVNATLKSSTGYLLFDSSGNARSGLTVLPNGTIDQTNTSEQKAAGAFDGSEHPAIAVADLSVSYDHLEAADALTLIEAADHGAAIEMSYFSLGLMQASVSNPNPVYSDTSQADAWLVEAGFRPGVASAEITNKDTGEISRFATNSGSLSASVFAAASGWADSHLTFDAAGAVTEQDTYNGDGTVSERHLYTLNQSEVVTSQEEAFFVPGSSTASSVLIENAAGQALQTNTFDASGNLTEQDTYATPGSPSGLLMRTFEADGSTSISQFSSDGTYIALTADYAKGAAHASSATTTAADGSSIAELFSSSDHLLSATSYDSNQSPLQSETFNSSGQLSLLEEYLTGGHEIWRYDTTGALSSFVTTVGTAHDWVKQPDGTWFDADTNSTSASMPSSIPHAPPLLAVINADPYALPTGFVEPHSIASVLGYHY